jgi:peptidoglycan/xylan/chitin deacetylase (PgdA/CDA1 family)
MAASLSASLLRAAAGALAPGGASGKLTILIYHRVLATPDPLLPGEVDATRFSVQMELVARMFALLPLREAVGYLRTGGLPPRAACITFDDGYRDNHDVALPILQRLGIPATFFVASGFLDGGRMWNDTVIETVRRTGGTALDLTSLGLGLHPIDGVEQRRRTMESLIGSLKYREPLERVRVVERIAECAGVALPDDLMMSSAQVKALADAGMEIGGHTVNHPILARSSADAAEMEISAGKARLEQITGRAVRLFAYPNGRPGRDYAAEHVEQAKRAGFEAAVSTAWGVATLGCDTYQLPRFTPWDRSELAFGLRLLRNLRNTSAQRA